MMDDSLTLQRISFGVEYPFGLSEQYWPQRALLDVLP